MRARGFWTDKRVERLKAMWAHETVRDIADSLGTSRNAVIGKADRLGLAEHPCRYNRLPPKKQNELIAAYKSGLKIRAIESKFNIDRQTLYKYIHVHNAPLRQGERA